MTKEERDAILNRKMSDKEVADRISEPAGDIYTKPSISDQFLSFLDEEIKKCEYGKEHYDFASHATALNEIKAIKLKYQSLLNGIENESKG